MKNGVIRAWGVRASGLGDSLKRVDQPELARDRSDHVAGADVNDEGQELAHAGDEQAHHATREAEHAGGHAADLRGPSDRRERQLDHLASTEHVGTADAAISGWAVERLDTHPGEIGIGDRVGARRAIPDHRYGTGSRHGHVLGQRRKEPGWADNRVLETDRIEVLDDLLVRSVVRELGGALLVVTRDRDVDEPSDSCELGGIGQRSIGGKIDGQVAGPARPQRGADAGAQAGDHRLAAIEDPDQRRRNERIADPRLDPIGQVGRESGRVTPERDHLMAASERLTHDLLAECPRCSGDQDPAHADAVLPFGVGRVQHAADLIESLSTISLPDGDNQEFRLGDLWATQTVVLIHLRHFGCILCRHYAGRLRDSNAAFEAVGARLVAVGTGGREYAKTFVTERKIPYLVLVDKTLVTHDLIGTKSGSQLGVFKPSTLYHAAKALAAGERQGKTGPNPFLFGAAHVIAAGGALNYAWLNDDYQNNAPVSDLLAAAREAVTALADAPA